MAQSAGDIQTEIDLLTTTIRTLLSDSTASITSPDGRAMTQKDVPSLYDLREGMERKLAAASTTRRPFGVGFQKPV